MSTSDWSIGPATAADVPAIEALLRASRLPANDVARWIDRFVVARACGTVVGAAGLERYGVFGLLRSVVVLPEWRGRGMAGAMVRVLVDRARAESVATLYLLTDTAQDYFARYGFTPVDRAALPPPLQDAPQVRVLCPATAHAMQRRLHEAA